jgi:hypothetical protein
MQTRATIYDYAYGHDLTSHLAQLEAARHTKIARSALAERPAA